jgi:glycosyltransferase involved in cell wall biosynthesis
MKNFVDVRRMDNLCAMDDVRHYDGQDYIVANEDQQRGSIVAQMLPLIPATDEKGNRNHRFVTVGRFSGEKNHDHLIHAVHKLRQEGQPVYLYILGNGPLKTDMEALVNSLGLNDCVFMPGNVANPFAVMKNCDCFILPSLHEGQPMVIHEARGLKMPIIVSNFSSVGGVLVEDGQLVIGTEVEDIYRGMMKFIDGEVPAGYEYDIHTYNREAYAEFEKVLEQE